MHSKDQRARVTPTPDASACFDFLSETDTLSDSNLLPANEKTAFIGRFLLLIGYILAQSDSILLVNIYLLGSLVSC